MGVVQNARAMGPELVLSTRTLTGLVLPTGLERQRKPLGTVTVSQLPHLVPAV